MYFINTIIQSHSVLQHVLHEASYDALHVIGVACKSDYVYSFYCDTGIDIMSGHRLDIRNKLESWFLLLRRVLCNETATYAVQ